MSIIPIETTEKKYDVYIENDFSGLVSAFEKCGLAGKKVLCVFDSNTAELFSDKIEELLAPCSKGFFKHIIPAGEGSKSPDELMRLYEKLIELSFSRDSVIIAAGGGVVGDLAGFAASTFMRGIAYVQIPTTLLSQVDSSVGGKTAINLNSAKNMVGSFYQPELVYINTSALKTLPNEEFLSGLCEIIKCVLIDGILDFDYLINNKDRIMALENEAVSYIIEKAISVKASVVKKDERDNGIRNILNFGHTFGHAIESACGYTIPHGICVGIGMRAALFLSGRVNEYFSSDFKKCMDLLDIYGVPAYVAEHSAEELYNYALKDKKIKDGKMGVILLYSPGKSYRNDSMNKEDILWAFEQITGKN